MPELKLCSQCDSKMTEGTFSTKTGELACGVCMDKEEIPLDKETLLLLQGLAKIHLDELDTIHYKNNSLIKSIKFLDSFGSFHIEGLINVRSFSMVRHLITGSC